MSSIIVQSQPIGPVSVELIDRKGRLVAGPALVSASDPRAVFPDIEAGTYTLVATRPAGEAFFQLVEMGSTDLTVPLHRPSGSPHEWLSSAAGRGQVPAETEEGRSKKDGLAPWSLAGTAGLNLRALSLAGGATGRGFGRQPTERPLTAEYSICGWQLSDGAWRPLSVAQVHDTPSAYLQLEFADGACVDRAVGLLDGNGYGPIVIVPPFVDGIDITFLAEGLKEGHGGARIENPSAIRTPVALAMPRDPVMADLLTALHAPAMPQAAKLWRQIAAPLENGTPDVALEVLAEKLDKRTEAILGGLFLARFAPDRIPATWIDKLSALTPEAADSAMLLAWLAMTRPSDPPQSHQSVAALLKEALRRPCTRFARTRSQLGQALRLYAEPSPLIGDYLNFAADAGGLEAFWGRSPELAGLSLPSRTRPPEGEIILLSGGQFYL